MKKLKIFNPSKFDEKLEDQLLYAGTTETPGHGTLEFKDPQWGLAFDVDRCIGCEACVIACNSENNIPVVGDKECARGRMMDWLHIERTYIGNKEAPTAEFVGMLCQQCGNAPCESVCPVYASQHTFDGLNAQIYPRCIGTRYCGQDCPYHVRVFNFFQPYFPHPLPEQLNPDVTVRSSGVMEKCTFCIQRVREAQRDARMEGKPLQDGELRTACVQSCPTSALVFGDLHDPNSAVSKYLAESDRTHKILEDKNTKPHVIYLKPARVDEPF
jgi:molybdopterin-containing oxidoreductase family iron-sulfur binding subunit